MSRTKAINELKSMIIVAPEHLRAQLRGLGLAKQLDRIDTLASSRRCPGCCRGWECRRVLDHRRPQ